VAGTTPAITTGTLCVGTGGNGLTNNLIYRITATNGTSAAGSTLWRPVT